MDFKENNEKLNKITMTEPDENLKQKVLGANKKMLLNAVPVQLVVFVFATLYGIKFTSSFRYVCFGVAIIAFLVTISALLPHKLTQCQEKLTITDYKSIGSGKNTVWFATLYVSEIKDTVDVGTYVALSPATSLNQNKSEPPFAPGTEVKLIRYGKAFYYVPASILEEN